MTASYLKKPAGAIFCCGLIALYIALMGSHSNNVSDRAIFLMAERLADKYTRLEAQAESLLSLIEPENTVLDVLIQDEKAVVPDYVDLYRSYLLPDVSTEVAIRKNGNYAYWGFQIAEVKRIDGQNVAVIFKGIDKAEVTRMEKAFDGENTELPGTTGKIRYSSDEDGYVLAIHIGNRPLNRREQ